MQYNFDEIIDRKNTNAENTDGFRSYIFHAGPDMEFPYSDDEFIRMWVADMEFAVPPEVCQAIKDRVDKRIFGYSQVFDPGYYEAFSGWCRKMYDWDFPKEQLVFSPGIIPALYELVGDLVAADEKVLITTPAYGFFKHAATYNNRTLVCSPLQNDNGWFSIDFADLEQKAADPKVKLLIWCNPHNPTGRVFTQTELKKIGELCFANNVFVVSDEIHEDLTRQGIRHIPLAKLFPGERRIITCTSPSKSFNIAGNCHAHLFIPDNALRRDWTKNYYNGHPNALSNEASVAAYDRSEDWLEELRDYLDQSFAMMKQLLTERLPEAKFSIAQGTYLAWVDLSGYGLSEQELKRKISQAGVFVQFGEDFVDNGACFMRVNLASPRSVVREGLERICRALE